MAWSSYKNQMDYLSLPRQSESSNTDPTFSNGASVTQTPIDTATMSFPTEYGFYDPRVQRDSMLLRHDFNLPSIIGPPNPEHADDGTMQECLAQWNGIIEGPATDYHRPAENTVGVPSLDATAIVQRPSPPKDNDILATGGNRIRGRQPNKQENGDGPFECNWISCKHRRPFSCERVLMRHIKTQHVKPRSIDCPRCPLSFNRKDNMKEHLGRVHREYC
ncbi:hypothetical protein N7447_007523 [Penicillium robsamsonii]|uniref:uncharacterized protein n=1 Tax=Penicillium robsamsonii TaxID=1792511 RepID=UPI00254950AE|nr:uncharacterized protein N7447_007523 [Penicillium robsamsonii]KAJ5817515.1 hypothetical protein N7447_007523 [Penicillium robsamsonii]